MPADLPANPAVRGLTHNVPIRKCCELPARMRAWCTLVTPGNTMSVFPYRDVLVPVYVSRTLSEEQRGLNDLQHIRLRRK